MSLNIEVKKGGRRTVFLVGKYVIKIPRLRSWVSFIKGVCENLEERYWYSADGSRRRDPKREWVHDCLAEIYWADRFGLCVVMERCDTSFVLDDYQVKEDTSIFFHRDFELLLRDIKGFEFYKDVKGRLSNIGYTRKGKLVVIDYGYHGGTMDCYLGT